MNFKKVTIGLLLMVALWGVWPATPVHAADSDDLKIASCIAKSVSTRGQTYVRFLVDTMSLEGFYQEVIEPWGDILWSNQCQAFDILALIDRQDQIQRSLRNSFLTCDLGQLAAKQKAYYRIGAEIYYARHVVKRKVVVSVPYISLQELGAYQPEFADNKTLKSEMERLYVRKGKMTQREFDDLYYELQVKYSERKQEYKICPNTSWQEVADKFWEAVEHFESLGKEFGQNVSKKAQSIGTAFNAMVHSYSSLDAFLASHLEMSIDADFGGMLEDLGELVYVFKPGIDFVDAMIDGIREQLASQGKTVTQNRDYTYADIAAATSDITKRVYIHDVQAELEADFEARYMFAGNSVETFTDELDRLNRAITGSFGVLDQINKCSVGVLK